MAFSRPTLADLVDRIEKDMLSRLGLTAPVLRRAMVYVFSRVFAGAVHMLHGHLEYLGRQPFPDLSDEEFLLRHVALFGLTRKAATFAAGPVLIYGTDGEVIPAGTVMLRGDGREYASAAEATIAAGMATLQVEAAEAGEAGNAGEGSTMTFESPLPNVYATGSVSAGGLVGGSDEEAIEDLRARLLARLREPPHGGSAADYVAWALEVGGVTRAWCYPLEGGAGTVTVRFVRDDDSITFIPDAAEVAAVQAYIDERRPVTAAVTVAAPIADALPFTIHITPDTASNRAAVQAELAALLLRTGKPGGTILRSQIDVAVGVAEGIDDFSVTAPAADVVYAVGHMPVMGAITWV